MKFGKTLQDAIEDMQPEFRDKFLCYKKLKKVLKSLPAIDTVEQNALEPASTSGEGQGTTDAERRREYNEPEAHGDQPGGSLTGGSLTAEERAFVKMLNEELGRFNEFYIEKEEDYVIDLANLEDRLAKGSEAMQVLQIEVVKFHGTLVLLQNWSALNYAALVKILKKHDKHSKLALRSPYLANVLKQPFFSTEVLSELVERSEAAHLKLLEAQKAAAANGDATQTSPETPPTLIRMEVRVDVLNSDVSEIDPSIMRQTQTALSLWSKVKSMSIPVPDSADLAANAALKRPAPPDTHTNGAPEPVPKAAKHA